MTMATTGRRKRKLETDSPATLADKIAAKAKSHDDEVLPQGSSDTKRCKRLDFHFYDKPCLDLAKQLLGHRLVRKLADGTIVSGIIVETEAYLGAEDPSAHSYSGQTQRNKAMFMPPGTAYVYNIYGTYCCMNISSQGNGHAVLLRALEPKEGLDKMKELRLSAKKSPSKTLKDKELCNGPSKFCLSLQIDKATINELDLPSSSLIWLEEGETIPDKNVIVSTRIGIDGAGVEAASKPYRFYIRGNANVSKKDKNAEKLASSE